jgi:DNA invertase Pin-like site-specific DNA recombinase
VKRCAIYARYSSDLQSPTSIDDQERLCRVYAERHGWTVGSMFAERRSLVSASNIVQVTSSYPRPR